ncbi:MAG: putative rane protein, partial [Pseudonocardiales bacterium]|nr:putative rane protein [Pseudonocardiales bacterium]
MAFPHDLLTADEEVVAHLHPHWVTLIPATLWLIVICVASGVGIAFLPDGSAHGPLVIAI